MLILLSHVSPEEKNTRTLCFHMPRHFSVVIHFLHICNNVCTLWSLTTIAKRLEEIPVSILNGDITEDHSVVETDFLFAVACPDS